MSLSTSMSNFLLHLVNRNLARRILILCCFATVLCLPSSARAACESLSSTILGRSVEYCVALPPGYDSGAERYPVLYYLHGLFEHAQSWSEHSGQQTWESLISQGK